tara:strand:+ start:1032 stop:2162 length:1131 start_codon:yes stop_codon:yes gene_type:complete
MPSKSKQQQKFMGIVRAIQKGEAPAGKFSKAAQKAAKSMKKGSVRKYAKTKHDDLPKKVSEANVIQKIDRLAKRNKYGTVDGTQMNAKTARQIIAIFNHPKMNSYKSQMLKMKSHELADLTFKLGKALKIEGFGGELKGKDKEKFEKARKENAEVLGYKLTGKGDIKESIKEKVNPEMKKIYKLLLKYGNKERDAAKMIKKNYDYVAKTYRSSSPRDKAVVLVGLQSLGESLSKAEIKKERDKFNKTGKLPARLEKILKAKKEFEKKFKVKDIVVPGLEWMSKIKEGTCGYGVDGELGEEPAGPHLIKKSTNEANIKDIEQVLKKKSAKKIDGMYMDMTTANAIMTVYKALNRSNKKKFEKLPLTKMVDVTWKLVR